MCNSDLNIYLVDGGKVKFVADFILPEFDEKAADWINSVHCAAESVEEALRLAADYDAGKIQPENMAWVGKTIAVLKGA